MPDVEKNGLPSFLEADLVKSDDLALYNLVADRLTANGVGRFSVAVDAEQTPANPQTGSRLIRVINSGSGDYEMFTDMIESAKNLRSELEATGLTPDQLATSLRVGLDVAGGALYRCMERQRESFTSYTRKLIDRNYPQPTMESRKGQ